MRKCLILAVVLACVLSVAGCGGSSKQPTEGSSYSTVPSSLDDDAVQAEQRKIMDAVTDEVDPNHASVDIVLNPETRVFEVRVLRSKATPELIRLLKKHGCKIIYLDWTEGPSPA